MEYIAKEQRAGIIHIWWSDYKKVSITYVLYFGNLKFISSIFELNIPMQFDFGPLLKLIWKYRITTSWETTTTAAFDFWSTCSNKFSDFLLAL